MASEIFDVLSEDLAASLRRLILTPTVLSLLRCEASECSTVFDLSTRSESILPHRRRCRKVVCHDQLVLDEIERTLLPALTRDRCVLCRSHYDVVVYEKGDFFKEHVDFARVKRSAEVMPYFGLYSLAETACSGGDTIVEGCAHSAPTSPNGGLVCPAHLRHEASPVTDGVKIVLKFDFLVITSLPPPARSISFSSAEASLDISTRILERIPFFCGRIRFDEAFGEMPTKFAMPMLRRDEMQLVVGFMKGDLPDRADVKSLKRACDALCVEECVALPDESDWVQLLEKRLPVLMHESRMTDALWNRRSSDGLQPFIVAWVRDDDPTQNDLRMAAVVMRSGDVCAAKSRLGSFHSRVTFETDDYTEAAQCVLAAVGSRVMCPESLDVDDNDDNDYTVSETDCNIKELAKHFSFICELLADPNFQSESGGIKMDHPIEEQEYCNDGDFVDIFYSYKTMEVKLAFGLLYNGRCCCCCTDRR